MRAARSLSRPLLGPWLAAVLLLGAGGPGAAKPAGGGPVFATPEETAGYYGGHALTDLADGDPPIPILVRQRHDGTVTFERIETGELRDSVRRGLAVLDANPHGDAALVLTYDTLLSPLPQGPRTDALIVELRQAGTEEATLFVLRYRPRTHPRGFAVLSPRIHKRVERPLRSADPARVAHFLTGLRKHPLAGPLWRRHHRASLD